jgi:hypothetical protein
LHFDVLDTNEKPPSTHAPCELMWVFDIKMDFTRKARLCTQGDLTRPPETLTYSSVVSRESLCIAFLVAALNDLDIMMFDVGNAYVYAKAREKPYVKAGIEFGEYASRYTPFMDSRAQVLHTGHILPILCSAHSNSPVLHSADS